MAQNDTNMTNGSQMDVDWNTEVRYPDVPAQPAEQISNQVSMTALPTQQGSPFYHISYAELLGEDFPSVSRREPLDMENPLSQESMANPMSNEEVYQGSMKSLLARNVGYYVLATFQIGSQGTVTVPGILHTVGNDYIILYQPEEGRYVTGDFYALKFVDFHETDSIPRRQP